MELEFVDQEITAYGGLAILKQMLTQSGFVDKLEHLPLDNLGLLHLIMIKR